MALPSTSPAEHLLPQARAPTKAELSATAVVSLQLEEVSAKVRTGPPKDDVPDYELPIWAGVLPVDQMCFGTPLPDPKLPESVPVPQYIAEYQRQKPLPAST